MPPAFDRRVQFTMADSHLYIDVPPNDVDRLQRDLTTVGVRTTAVIEACGVAKLAFPLDADFDRISAIVHPHVLNQAPAAGSRLRETLPGLLPERAAGRDLLRRELALHRPEVVQVARSLVVQLLRPVQHGRVMGRVAHDAAVRSNSVRCSPRRAKALLPRLVGAGLFAPPLQDEDRLERPLEVGWARRLFFSRGAFSWGIRQAKVEELMAVCDRLAGG